MFNVIMETIRGYLSGLLYVEVKGNLQKRITWEDTDLVEAIIE